MPTPRPESEHLAASFLKLFPWQRGGRRDGLRSNNTPVVRRAVSMREKNMVKPCKRWFSCFLSAVFWKDDTLPADGPAPHVNKDAGILGGVLNMKRPFWSPQDGRRDPPCQTDLAIRVLTKLHLPAPSFRGHLVRAGFGN